MLTAVSWCLETLTTLLRSPGRWSQQELTRVVLSVLACVGVLVVEYRLLVPGLITAILAVLLAGLARALRRIVSEQVPTTFHTARINILTCGAGLVITGVIVAFQAEDTWTGFLAVLKLRHLPLLFANAVVTAAAILTGQSIFFPLDKLDTYLTTSRTHLVWSYFVIPMFMVASIGLAMTLSLRRSYMSSYQFIFFSLSALSIVGAPNWNNAGNAPKRYQSVVGSADLPIVDHDGDFDLEPLQATQVTMAKRPWQIVLDCRYLSLLLLPFLWIPYQMLNFSENIYQAPHKVYTILDHQYTPNKDLEVVISMYKEPVEDVVKLITTLRLMPNLRETPVRIYIKDSEADVSKIQARTKANKVIILPNVGREGETYLNHILNNWDTLARQTVFLQADVHNPREFYPRISTYFDPARTGMLSLGWSGNVCACGDCGDRFGFQDTTHLFPHIHDRINNSSRCENMLLSYKGQFIVSAKRIRGIDKSIYQGLHDAFTDEKSWAHQEAYLQGRPDSMSAPILGYAVERIWNLLFQCNDMDVAWKCPSLLSGNRLGGSIQDCQCFDE